MREIHSSQAPKPFSNYAQAIAVPAGNRLLFVSGQVGIELTGEIPEDPARQHELAWSHVLALLRAEGLDQSAIADARVFITSPDHVRLYREVRDRMLKGHRPAATLLVVAGLADPRFCVEVTVVAAAPAT